jgi:hypothetical protein
MIIKAEEDKLERDEQRNRSDDEGAEERGIVCVCERVCAILLI